jgi:hypothetical protein
MGRERGGRRSSGWTKRSPWIRGWHNGVASPGTSDMALGPFPHAKLDPRTERDPSPGPAPPGSPGTPGGKIHSGPGKQGTCMIKLTAADCCGYTVRTTANGSPRATSSAHLAPADPRLAPQPGGRVNALAATSWAAPALERGAIGRIGCARPEAPGPAPPRNCALDLWSSKGTRGSPDCWSAHSGCPPNWRSC